MRPLQSAVTEPVSGRFPKTHHIPAWYQMGDVRRLRIIREIVESYGRDPRIAETAVTILKQAGVAPRSYVGQAEALLQWVQRNIYYINEPGERLQSPLYTLEKRFGDCDDEVILLCSFFEACRLPWKLALAGKAKDGRLIQYIEGERLPKGVKWTHIYCIVGDQPFRPKAWFPAEPTLQVPLGWDVVQAYARADAGIPVPELGQTGGRSTGAAIGATVAADNPWKRVYPAIIIGAATAITTEILLEFIRSSHLYLDWRESRQQTRKKRKKAK